MAGKWRGCARPASSAQKEAAGRGPGRGTGSPEEPPGGGAGALVDPRQAAAEIGWEALLAGQLLEPAADLAQCLRPAAGRVGQQRDLVTLVAEVLGDRRAEEHRR